jgi:hypothetical protein
MNKLKASSSIKADRVNDAIEDMQEVGHGGTVQNAQRSESIFQNRLYWTNTNRPKHKNKKYIEDAKKSIKI